MSFVHPVRTKCPSDSWRATWTSTRPVYNISLQLVGWKVLVHFISINPSLFYDTFKSQVHEIDGHGETLAYKSNFNCSMCSSIMTTLVCLDGGGNLTSLSWYARSLYMVYVFVSSNHYMMNIYSFIHLLVENRYSSKMTSKIQDVEQYEERTLVYSC